MSVVLVKHDHGCKWARASSVEIDDDGHVGEYSLGGGHSDAAKRFADWYNLHKAAGMVRGWIGIALADGASNGDVYETRAEAVRFHWPNERWFFYCSLQQPSMSVCAAESVLRWRRVMNEMEGAHTDRDAVNGGLEVIPRLSAEDLEGQIQAVRSGKGAIALGHRKG